MATKNNKLDQGFIRDQKVIKELSNSSDRAKVILGAAIIDELLERLIRRVLVQDKTVIETTFSSGTGFLANFSSKIKICYLLGIISEELFKDFETLRKIRNQFAHNILDCDFNDQSVRDLCDNFYFVKKAFGPNDDKSQLFILEIAVLQVALIKKITRAKSLKKHQDELMSLAFEDVDYKYLDGH